MAAKESLVEFLKTAPKADDRRYTFVLPASELPDTYIHRMRVALNRLRTELREQGRTLRPFKMLVRAKARQPNGTYLITLEFVEQTGRQRAIADLHAALNVLENPVQIKPVTKPFIGV